MIKRLRPYLGVGLAVWLGWSATAVAQGDFYIELRGPESAEPARPAPPATTAAPAQPQAQPTANPEGYGPIRNTDTLWAIAARYTRAPATVHQTMVALYRLNPQAFVRGNINHLQRGAQLRLPTDTQIRQRSATEAEAEFRRLSRQGAPGAPRVAATPAPNKPEPVVQAKPAPQPAAPPQQSAPVIAPSAPQVAQPPKVSQETDNQTDDAAQAAMVLSEPKTVPEPVAQPAVAPSPAQVEEVALNRLQLQLMDELREQVAMTNEQLVMLADNNQALRLRLAQLTAEVEGLKVDRSQNALDDKSQELNTQEAGGVGELLKSPLNLALILMLPVLLLLALLTLWWRKRKADNQAEPEQKQGQELSPTGTLPDDERDEFEDVFASQIQAGAQAGAADEKQPEQDVNEDAFARYLEEQQLLEEQEAQRRQAMQYEANEEQSEAPIAEAGVQDASGPAAEDEGLQEEAQLNEGGESLSTDDIDELFNDVAVTARENELPADPEPLDEPEEAAADTTASKPEEAYVSVDQLMADAERSEGLDPDMERKLELDLELDDYAGVIGQGDGVDIDADEGGIGAQLDLARAYLEINDVDSARELLNEAIKRGNEAQQRDAQKLLQRLDKRS
ncbi:FimV/HubP family polar landmark protein [Oceanisphaera sp.]|uniref:FimV/HubP family polar landmark protein n=1 Tax=Oceanisphaera sp. TaxID=1929979 RepID=UPI003A929DF5